MKRILTGILLALCGLAASAQTTHITASHISYFGGAPVTGQFCLSPTDASGNPINIVTTTGQQFTPATPLCFPIVAGVLSSYAIVPDVSTTQPVNACYALTVKNNANQVVANIPCIQPETATWSFDAYIPSTLPSIPALSLPQFQLNATPFTNQAVVNFSCSTCTYSAGTLTIPSGSTTTQAISGASYSASDTTIVASWYTLKDSDSHLTCGSKIAVDDGVQSAAKFHQAIVTGLSPSTLYACAVTSGATTSSSTNVTTLAAPTRTAITSVSIGSPTTTAIHGDTIYSCVSNDNVTYNTMDDGFGWTSANAGAAMQIDKLSNESALAGTTVNLLTAYGAAGSSNGTDGPSGASLSNKLSGIFCMGGNLYGFQSRIWNSGSNSPPPTLVQSEYAGSVIKSTDHGATWNSFQAPAAQGFALGIPPNPLGSFQFATTAYAWCEPVRYAIDDGTNGYLTAGNRIDGADAFVYISCTDGHWNNGSALYELRIPRAQLSSQNAGAAQYWVGPSSPTSAQFVADSNWSSSASSATAIYSASGQVSAQDLTFIPGYNEYMLLTWYNPGSTPVSSSSTWNVLTGPTPAGPWTSLATPSYSPSGYYNPVIMHRTAASNTGMSNTALQVVFGGDYLSGYNTYYFPTYATLTLNPPVAAVYLNTTFNEASTGNLAGTTPTTCTSGCVGPWALASGTDFQYQAGGGVASNTSNAAWDLITAGPTNYTLRFHVASLAGSGAVFQAVSRYVNSSNFLGVNLYGTGSVQVYDVVSGTGNLKGTVSGVTYPADFTLTVNGTAFTLVTPAGNIASTTANATGTVVGFDLNTAGTSAARVSSLSVKSF